MKKILNKNILILGISMLGGVLLGVFIIYRILLYIGTQDYQKPKAWILSQNLGNTLLKQQMLKDAERDGSITVSDIAKIATSSTTLKGEAIKIVNKYYLSTGSNGTISLTLPTGLYKVSLAEVPGADFTGVPKEIKIEKGTLDLKIGLKQGKGELLSTKDILISTDSNLQDKNPQIAVSLYHDKNGNGEKGQGEPQLSWSGVVLSLEKQN